MEIKTHIRLIGPRRGIMLSGIMVLICACSCHQDGNFSLFSSTVPSEHTLLALAPDFSISVTGDTINKCYPRLRSGKIFPITGILRVDGKSYRFMGGDSMRISSLVPLSDDSLGWQGKYSYLFPGEDWEKSEYDDSLWNEGNGAFGLLKGKYPVHTAWGSENIYIRRHIRIDDKEDLKERKVYIRYICDDQMKLYCNGKYLFGKNYCIDQTECRLLTNETVSQIVEGDNVLAAYGRNTGGLALLDFGLYVENKTYADAELAVLKQMDVQTTQTHYAFQCGDVELRIDFVSPALSEKWNLTGWPVGFFTYHIHSEDKKQHNVEIMFDVDMKWLFGKGKVDNWVEQDWRFVKSDSLYLAVSSDETTFLWEGGHAIFSQNLCAGNENKGVLLLGYEEGQTLQYEGESLCSLWNKDGRGEIKELIKSVGDRYQELQEECNQSDYRWRVKALRTEDQAVVGRMFSSYRAFVASHRFMLSPDKIMFCFGDTLGNVRETCKTFPVLSFFGRIDWMKGLLDPLFKYCEDLHWNKKYPPYDIGLHPIAAKQIKLEDCAVEAAANMLMMTTVVVEAEQDFGYADVHWEQLCLWANYLQERMKKETFPVSELLDEKDERVKCVLGLKAYHKLVQWRKAYE